MTPLSHSLCFILSPILSTSRKTFFPDWPVFHTPALRSYREAGSTYAPFHNEVHSVSEAYFSMCNEIHWDSFRSMTHVYIQNYWWNIKEQLSNLSYRPTIAPNLSFIECIPWLESMPMKKQKRFNLSLKGSRRNGARRLKVVKWLPQSEIKAAYFTCLTYCRCHCPPHDLKDVYQEVPPLSENDMF